MSYQSSKTKKTNILPFLVFLLVLVVTVLLFSGFVARGVTYVQKNSLISDLFVTSTQYQTVVAENEELKKLLAEQSIQSHLATGWAGEYWKYGNLDLVVASVGVLATPPVSPYDTYILDAGKKKGLMKGQVILINKYEAVGIVSNTTSSQAKATLFSYPGKTTSMVIGSSFFQFTGVGGGLLNARLPRDFPAKVGQSVHLPGSNLYIVGYVTEVLGAPQDAFKQVTVKLAGNLYQTTNVSVVEYENANINIYEQEEATEI